MTPFKRLDQWLSDPVKAGVTIAFMVIATGIMDVFNFIGLSNMFTAAINIIVAILIIFVVDRSKKVTK